MSTTRTSAAAVRSLLRHGEDALAQWDWDAAREYAGRALDGDGRSADAHLLFFLANRHITSIAELPSVAAQIVLQTPPSVTPLLEVLDAEAADGAPSHDTTRALLRSHPDITMPTAERLSNLRSAQAAFDAVFDDPHWQMALERSPLERMRAMERAREEADAVFDEAFREARDEVSRACAVAEMRVPRVAKETFAAAKVCERALEELDRSNGAADTAVSESFSYLRGDIRTARVGLWVGVLLVAGATAMLGLALIPHGSDTGTTNVLASFTGVSTVVALCVLVAGIVLLALRGYLVRSNRRGLRQRVETRADLHERATSRAERLEDDVAAIRAACRALETLPLADESFEDALEELAAGVAVLGGAKAEPQSQSGHPEAPVAPLPVTA